MSGAVCPVCEECFSTAINVEISAKIYYLKMADLFAGAEAAAEVFKAMARGEVMHARTLEEAKTHGQHSDRVHDNAQSFTRALLRVVAEYGEKMREEPRNLDEAFEFSWGLERSEINNVYIRLFVGTRDEPDGGERFVTDLINEHLRQIKNLDLKYDKPQRQAILPRTK